MTEEFKEEKKNILAILPVRIEKRLRAEAKDSRRSRNAQLVWILERHFAEKPEAREQQQAA